MEIQSRSDWKVIVQRLESNRAAIGSRSCSDCRLISLFCRLVVGLCESCLGLLILDDAFVADATGWIQKRHRYQKHAQDDEDDAAGVGSVCGSCGSDEDAEQTEEVQSLY
ncbi:hypothetical protein [Segatella baroniae]|uniref:hypothetical protein n=1 Tax=Segatella baroniae TaxID=305719 RepID=UPI001EE37904|nr:hypothetical protein [Segatella baroniae]